MLQDSNKVVILQEKINQPIPKSCRLIHRVITSSPPTRHIKKEEGGGGEEFNPKIELIISSLQKTEESYFNSNATTFSTCGVCGNMSTGCTAVTLYFASSNCKSRA